ncbi:MAG TPA: AmmeMemoRadiSam system protein A [Terriglobia bacterium]|nr:AmmeMemoRadiSam system protein A [Terriglobia bacterium]
MSPLTEDDERTLLGVARRALESAVEGRALSEFHGFARALREKAGAFVTLRRQGSLRGCIGQVEPREPLVQTVAQCAVAAALRDPRFPPVDPLELAAVTIEISVLSPLLDILPEQIEIGRHGLLVSRGSRRGLLLPQVAEEWGWDAERFLEETCLKAGLAPDEWRRGARLQAFTTQVFAESSEPQHASPAANRPSRPA